MGQACMPVVSGQMGGAQEGGVSPSGNRNRSANQGHSKSDSKADQTVRTEDPMSDKPKVGDLVWYGNWTYPYCHVFQEYHSAQALRLVRPDEIDVVRMLKDALMRITRQDSATECWIIADEASDAIGNTVRITRRNP